ncbi:MAG TPA: LysM peptidoglycan-binding domain-containing protein [Anaerolineae bacterium]|nr:LysM peptidoglycan-binding domain-containing protein [Anaerolineae bacterium]HQH37435.1 LysM peptidoglycan-binding domain-containing protein [Anaerolineae bacterium]
MLEEKSIHRQDIVVGLGVGLGVGLFVLVAVLLLLRPSPEPTPEPGVAWTVEPLPTATWTPEALLLPSATPSAEPTPTATATAVTQWVTYTVKSGDVLSTIAYHFGVAVEAVVAANNLQEDVIYPDQELLIPLDENAIAQLTTTPQTAASPMDQLLYEVRAGDTLGEIAQKYGVTVDDIKVANGLTSDIIQAGESLVVPQKVQASTVPSTTTVTTATTTMPTALLYR